MGEGREPPAVDDGRRWTEAWAASGAMALTGWPDRDPLPAPPGLMPLVDHLGQRIEQAAAVVGSGVTLDWPALLGERAAFAHLSRHGDRSCGGGTRLLPAADGWMAVTLARDDDVDMLPAWLEVDVDVHDPWPGVADALRERSAGALVERAAPLGLPVARLGEVDATSPAVRARRLAAGPAVSSADGCVVVDLSSLWAGPLCAHLLGLAGARVIKVESVRRPDGARRGPRAFFDLLHAGHESVALDFVVPGERSALHGLVARADVVIEASRPRALAQLGLEAERVVATGRCRAWVSLTGHGREGVRGQRTSFGDDAAVAGGLVAHDAERGPCFCADAVADPLAGLTAAAAALDALRDGGRWMLDVSLAASAAAAAGPRPGLSTGAAGPGHVVAAPRARRPAGAAPALGAHTDAVIAELLP